MKTSNKTIMQNPIFSPYKGMRVSFFAIFSCLWVLLSGCGETFTDSRYILKMPSLPQSWEELLGSAFWQIEYINNDGKNESVVLNESKSVEINLLQNCSNAVLAYPYWPDRGIVPGVFKPAGAIFPFDVSGNKLVISWQGGVDAYLFREFSLLAGGTDITGKAVSRLPQNFNWPRFRKLFDDLSVNAEVRCDPWLADWTVIAEKTVLSGFDKRRLIPEARVGKTIPVNCGPWAGTSPFASPLLFNGLPSFPVRTATDTWICAEGILRCNSQTWIFVENK